MHSFKEVRKMPYKASDINDIVLDVEKYPEFLPWCSSARVISVNNGRIVADLTAEFKGFSENYRSQITAHKEGDFFIVNVEAISGPFKYLKNSWKIKSLNNECEIDFSIAFEFKSKILDMVIGMVFSIATEKMISAFEARARELKSL
jgi:coenzyme Q-binding protein COQ10